MEQILHWSYAAVKDMAGLISQEQVDQTQQNQHMFWSINLSSVEVSCSSYCSLLAVQGFWIQTLHIHTSSVGQLPCQKLPCHWWLPFMCPAAHLASLQGKSLANAAAVPLRLLQYLLLVGLVPPTTVVPSCHHSCRFCTTVRQPLSIKCLIQKSCPALT